MGFNLKWRIIALLALCVYVLVVLGVILIIARNLGFALLLGITAMVATYATWLLFTGTHARARAGKWLLAASAVALGGGLVVFIGRDHDWLAGAVVLLLSVCYILLGNALRQKYWRDARQQGEASGETVHFRNPYLIINPKSGNGRAMRAHIDTLAKAQGIAVIFTKKDEDVGLTARHAVRAGADVLGISGGDGSIGAVAKVALEHGLPMVVLPGGTRCHFARDLGLDPERIADALAGFRGVERRVDVADINGRVFLNNASFGLYADIVDHPDYREHKLQASRDVLRAIVSGTKDLYDLQFQHGTLRVNKAAQVLVGVNAYETLDVFELGHRQQLDGGVLQITAVTQLNDAVVRGLLRDMSIDQIRGHAQLQDVHQWLGKTFTVTSSARTIVAGVDGEREVYMTPVTVRILPQALRLFVPAEGIRTRPKNPFSGSVVRRIWRAIVAK